MVSAGHNDVDLGKLRQNNNFNGCGFMDTLSESRLLAQSRRSVRLRDEPRCRAGCSFANSGTARFFFFLQKDLESCVQIHSTS